MASWARLRSWSSPFHPRKTTLDAHDDWNIVAIGALNLAHVGWWCGAVSGSTALNVLFVADAAYLMADTCWVLFVPNCVPARVAAGKPVLMRHLLRTWVVELHSWVHIASRRLRSKRLAQFAAIINKPAFFALRIVTFPLTYLAYVHDRRALSATLLEAHSPLRVHAPLSLTHLAMYGLMLKWGYTLLLS